MNDLKSNLKEIASKRIRQAGYNAFSFRDLANEIGIKSSSVHYYFPTKAALVEELANDYKDNFFKRLELETAKLVSPSSKILVLIKLYEESLSKNLNCLCGMLASEIDLLSDKEKKAIKSFYNELEIKLNSILSTTPLKIDKEVNEIVYLIMSSLNGSVVLDRVYEGKKRLNALKSFVKKII
ncbi:MAG: TetR/AcrR family transcriptional regulator [Leptospiraceae bacterium]|nr:TetR/AcrR family transcriptional regulator [Leptospiraceae bacterium]